MDITDRQHTERQAAVQKIERFLDQVARSVQLNLSFTVRSSGTASSEIIGSFEGADTPLLTGHNGELLHALEHLAAKILRLEPEHHHLLVFDADGFKASRERSIRSAAHAALASVRATNKPYSFPPMTSRERRMLHLALSDSGFLAASTGEGSQRHVVLHPTPRRSVDASAPSQISHQR